MHGKTKHLHEIKTLPVRINVAWICVACMYVHLCVYVCIYVCVNGHIFYVSVCAFIIMGILN